LTEEAAEVSKLDDEAGGKTTRPRPKAGQNVAKRFADAAKRGKGKTSTTPYLRKKLSFLYEIQKGAISWNSRI